MLIELNYVLFSVLLWGYSSWCYFKRREKGLLYLTLGFAFLTLSTMLQLTNSLIWAYRIQASIMMLRLLELCGLALFACFTISVVVSLKEISKKSNRTSAKYSNHSGA